MVLRILHTHQHLLAFAVIPAYTRPLTQFRVSAHHATLLRMFHASFPSRAQDNKDTAPNLDVKSETGPAAIEGSSTVEGDAAAAAAAAAAAVAAEGDIKITADSPEATAKTTQETGPANPSRRRKKFFAWVKDEGAKYQKPAFGTTNYVNERIPFPMNPFFRPNPPVADQVREAIYKSYMQNPEIKTPRILATEYNLSIRRVEAILKLKALESRMVEGGFTPQKAFTKGMEQLLGTHESQLRESLKDVVPRVGKPRFKMIQEEVEFNAEDAAAALDRTSHALMQKQAMQRETYSAFVLEDGGESQKKWEVVGNNPREGNKRFKFMIRDMGRKKAESLEEGVGVEEMAKRKPHLFVRDKDGTLRAAARSESMRH